MNEFDSKLTWFDVGRFLSDCTKSRPLKAWHVAMGRSIEKRIEWLSCIGKMVDFVEEWSK